MAIKRVVRMPEGDAYVGRFGHWLPNLLGSDDTVLGETAYFRLRFDAARRLTSPSPGHLGHAGIHVRQYRALKAKLGIGVLAYLVWPFVWWWNELLGGGTMEAEADAYAEANKLNSTLMAQYVVMWENWMRS